MRVKIRVQIEFEGDIPDDPAAYEGATTPKARMAKEKEWLESDTYYLLEWLTNNETDDLHITADVTRLNDEVH
jgi:hypothetical protein